MTRTRVRLRDRVAVFWGSKDAEWHKYGVAIVGLMLVPALGPWITYYLGLSGWAAGLLVAVPMSFCAWWMMNRRLPKRLR